MIETTYLYIRFSKFLLVFPSWRFKWCQLRSVLLNSDFPSSEQYLVIAETCVIPFFHSIVSNSIDVFSQELCIIGFWGTQWLVSYQYGSIHSHLTLTSHTIQVRKESVTQLRLSAFLYFCVHLACSPFVSLSPYGKVSQWREDRRYSLRYPLFRS